MKTQPLLPFFPKRFLMQGIAVLGGALLCSAGYLLFLFSSPPLFPLHCEQAERPKREPLVLDLGEPVTTFFPLPSLEQEISLSFDSLRPDSKEKRAPLRVKLNRSGKSLSVYLPCRIDLAFGEEGDLIFSEKSAFWMELTPGARKTVEFAIQAEGLNVEPVYFSKSPEPPPLLSLDEIPASSSFRLLAEAKCCGHDLFNEKYGDAQVISERVEVQGEVLTLKKGEWLGWKEGKWSKLEAPLPEIPLAQIQQSQPLILEGWEQENYYRFSLASLPPSPVKVRPEELFSSVRIRSDRQISCMLEKQALVLRTGDWVLKEEGKWRTLKRKEEKEALLAGRRLGEIFVLDKVGEKGAEGHLFNLSRSQCTKIELAASSLKQARKERKGKIR